MKNIKRKNRIRKLFNLPGFESEMMQFKRAKGMCRSRIYGSIFEESKKKKLYKKGI